MAVEIELRDIGRAVADACRAMGWSQRELSRRSGVPQTAISRWFRGRPGAIDLDQLGRAAAPLGIRLRVVVDAPILADRGRQRDRVHARCIGYVAVRLRGAGWIVATEMEIRSRRGPGWIDILAFHPGSGRLLVIEIKTEIDDFGRIQRTLGWYEHEAWAAARRLGWRPRTATPALVLLATAAVDARLRENRDVARLAFQNDARTMLAVIRDPSIRTEGPMLALVDPLARSRLWLRPSVLDGRNASSRHADYAAVARRLGG